MASVVVAATAQRDLRSLIESHSLPASTDARVRDALDSLREFPLIGAEIGGRWGSLRFILGPWRWMLIIYRYEASIDRVEVITIQDGRSARSPTSRR